MGWTLHEVTILVEVHDNALGYGVKMAALAPWTLQLDSNSWNQRLVNYVKAEQYKKTLELFQRVQKEGMIPDTFTLFLS
ncbi:unnamed protein product [Sphagnum jensenii]|uniref:Uncharacterized protein n=1 Tax=Sphagnum jensenii TaxID=128206 RepID=A0ABP0XHX9_9BRYO